MRTLISILTVLLMLSCSSRRDLNASDSRQVVESKGEQPSATQNLNDKMNKLRQSMIAYLNTAHPPYSKQDVATCLKILDKYKTDMAITKSKDEGMEVVKATVLQLNKLNEKCDGTLIETGEREQIAEIIILSGNQKGYNAADEDITEPWREW